MYQVYGGLSSDYKLQLFLNVVGLDSNSDQGLDSIGVDTFVIFISTLIKLNSDDFLLESDQHSDEKSQQGTTCLIRVHQTVIRLV